MELTAILFLIFISSGWSQQYMYTALYFGAQSCVGEHSHNSEMPCSNPPIMVYTDSPSLNSIRFNINLQLYQKRSKTFLIAAAQTGTCSILTGNDRRRFTCNGTQAISEIFSDDNCQNLVATVTSPLQICTNTPIINSSSDDPVFWEPLLCGIELPNLLTPEQAIELAGSRDPSRPIPVREVYMDPTCENAPSVFFYHFAEQCTFLATGPTIDPSIVSCDDSTFVTTRYVDRTCNVVDSALQTTIGTCFELQNVSLVDRCTRLSSSTNIILPAVLGTVLPCLICVICILGVVAIFPRVQRRNLVKSLNLDTKIPILSDVEIEEKIGKGQFGEVFKGSWQGNEVALKSLSHGTILEFNREIEILNELRHPNVISFYGLYVTANRFFVVTEYMNQRDLLGFLHKEYETPVELLCKFAVAVAKGIEYLHTRKVIHRDISARNILVALKSNEYFCKIADFGLSRTVETEYVAESTQFPIRWTAPEALEFRKFNEKSDIWSFGVLMWEIFSRGATPYAGITNKRILKEIKNGWRLAQPLDAPQPIFALMQTCWLSDPHSRPSMTQLRVTLEDKVDFVTHKRPASLHSLKKVRTNLEKDEESEPSSETTESDELKQREEGWSVEELIHLLKEERQKVKELQKMCQALKNSRPHEMEELYN